MCDENYYGNPELPGGSCKECFCNNNVDVVKPGNCDHHTGKCMQCLFDTEGDNCEVCKTGFYGDAILQTCAGKKFDNYFGIINILFISFILFFVSMCMQYFGITI